MVDERRQYFRIEDEVNLHINAISTTDLEQRISDFWSDTNEYSIRSEFNSQIEQHLADLKSIEIKSPELARYLKVLQTQIERLTDRLLPSDEETTSHLSAVSLSAQGLGYQCDDKFAANDMLEVNLGLLPSGLNLVMLGRVVLVDKSDGDSPLAYRVSLNFDHIREPDREILSKHIHEHQMLQLRSVREASS